MNYLRSFVNYFPNVRNWFTPMYRFLDVQGNATLIKTSDGKVLKAYPYHMTQLTMDYVVYDPKNRKTLMIVRKNEPFKGHLALTGGFADLVDGEDIFDTAKREAKEEIDEDSGTFEPITFRANKERDPRGYTTTCVFYHELTSEPKYTAGDDAASLVWVDIDSLQGIESSDVRSFVPNNAPEGVKGIAFDHLDILKEVFAKKSLIRK